MYSNTSGLFPSVSISYQHAYIMLSPLPSVLVHGFHNNTYNLAEGEQLTIRFDSEAKGNSRFKSLEITGRVTSEADTAGE